ncbi:MAG: FecR domain-containing protein [Myxococcales bacterium]|nr:FecR domain-containing protein [Myxococcales bacterium]MCB9714340.1 FecR domain-containing protein [Myxococcales bacterium]
MSIWMSTAVAAAAAAVAAPEPAPPVETIEYTIRKGDTCAKIATERYGDRKHFEVIHQYNRWLGPTMPHHLEEGQVLILPKTLPPELPDAEVTAARRKVEARPPEAAQWSSARPGLDLYRGWRVNTQERASAEITFRDYSRIEMRENTLVIIYGGSRSRSRRETTEATLDRGALRARLGAYTGKTSESEVTVTTPSAVAELEGGTSLVTVDDGGTSRVANHGDGKAKVGSSTGGGAKVKVGPKMGSKVVKGERPSAARPLPPTPVWSGRMATTFVAAGGRGTIRGSWAPAEKAARYRVEIASQPDGRELVASQTVPATINRFEAQGLPAGDYYVSVAAIDDDDFESPPSDHRKLSLVSVPLLTPGGAPLPEPDAAAEPSTTPSRVLRGTRLDFRWACAAAWTRASPRASR